MFRLVILLFFAFPGFANAQEAFEDPGALLMNQASGTSMNPLSWPMPMLMRMAGDWHLMFMGQAFVLDTQQTGPRGSDKFYSVNYGMFAAEHSLAGGSFRFDLMLSLEPATITERRYPELFQTGETAFGVPIVDGQHPHNFIMGLGYITRIPPAATPSCKCISLRWEIPRWGRWPFRIGPPLKKSRKRR